MLLGRKDRDTKTHGNNVGRLPETEILSGSLLQAP